MSRLTKFRAWVPQLESYGEVLDIHFSEEGLPEIIEVFINGSNHHLNAFEVVLEQHTGLKDKNGKEIYEGDIVKCEGELCACKSVAVVIWREKQAEFGIRWADCGVEDELDYWHNLRGPSEVIGNIHENPELLGGEE